VKRQEYRIAIRSFFWSLCTYSILFTFLFVAIGSYNVWRTNAICVKLVYLEHVLHNLENPLSVEELASSFSIDTIADGQYYFKDFETYYYPQALGKPGRILLRRKEGNFHYVVFGDGTRACLTYYYVRKDPNDPCGYIQPTLAEEYGRWVWFSIPLAGVSIAVGLILQKRALIKQSTTTESAKEILERPDE